MFKPTCRRLILTTLALATFGTLPASGQTINEDIKIVASDAAADDWFARPVAISGTTAIVGAFRNADAGLFTGSAYIFDTTTGQELFKLTASDAAAFDSFGNSVAISGTTAIVGAQHDDDAGSASGSAYLFDTTTGQQLAKLAASDATQDDQFGRSVVISGSTAIIGAYLDDNNGGSDSGSAYIFNMATPCPADLTAEGILDFFDSSLFLTYFHSSNPIADFNGDGMFNFIDVSQFLQAFNAGCP